VFNYDTAPEDVDKEVCALLQMEACKIGLYGSGSDKEVIFVDPLDEDKAMKRFCLALQKH
jgi:hypothetical protein